MRMEKLFPSGILQMGRSWRYFRIPGTAVRFAVGIPRIPTLTQRLFPWQFTAILRVSAADHSSGRHLMGATPSRVTPAFLI